MVNVDSGEELTATFRLQDVFSPLEILGESSTTQSMKPAPQVEERVEQSLEESPAIQET